MSAVIEGKRNLQMKMRRMSRNDERTGRRSFQIQSGEAQRLKDRFNEWRKNASLDLVARVWPVISWAIPSDFKFPHAPTEIILAKTPDVPDEAVMLALKEIGLCDGLAKRAGTTPKVEAGKWKRASKPRGVFFAHQESSGDKYFARYALNLSVDQFNLAH